MTYTITYPIITSDYSTIWLHELLYDPRHAVPANSNWTLRMLFWLCGLGFSHLLPCGFLPWGKEEEELAIHHEWRSSILLRQQRQFHQLCFLDFSRTQLFWNFCLLDLAGALLNRFSRSRTNLRKRIQSLEQVWVCVASEHVFNVFSLFLWCAHLSHVYFI